MITLCFSECSAPSSGFQLKTGFHGSGGRDRVVCLCLTLQSKQTCTEVEWDANGKSHSSLVANTALVIAKRF